MAKSREARCEFDRVSVAVDRQMKHLQDGIVFVDSKIILLGKSGNYKVSWKKVTSLITKDAGFYIESEKHKVEAVGPQGRDWQSCRKLLEKYWNKKQKAEQRKSLEQQEEEEEEQRRKLVVRRPVYGKTYSKRPLKFLSKNEGANNWDSEDDEDTFNISRPKRKSLEDDDDNQNGDVSSTPQGVEAEEYDDDDGEAELEETAKQDENEAVDSDDEELTQPRKRRFKKKRIHLEDDSDDENLFGDAEMTTPIAAKRIVSPATDGMNRLYDDEDDDGMLDGPSTTVHQESPTKGRKVAPVISSFFKSQKSKPTIASPDRKSRLQNKHDVDGDTKDQEQAPMKKTPPSTSFFAPKKKLTSPSEETVSTVLEPSQASTVIPSPAFEGSEDMTTTAPETPPRKTHSFGYASSIKKIEEEDPLLDDSPGDSRPNSSSSKPRPFRRDLLGRKTYGSSDRKRDTASMALEFANTHQSPVHRPMSLNMSPNRTKRFKKSPLSNLAYRSPSKSPMVMKNHPPAPIPDFRGIKNIGNTCYMNSSLQMLFSIPSFVQQLELKREGRPLVSSLWNLFQQLQERKAGAATARDLKEAVDGRTDKFRGYQQRDANEFLGDLLDTIHETLEGTTEDDKLEKEKTQDPLDNETKTKTKTDKKQLPTDDIFRLDVEVCLQCKSCGYSRTKEEMYRYLSVDIPQKDGNENPKRAVDKCLDAFFEPEDREIKCEKCEDGTVATQTMKVLSRPKAILLHLKRFVLEEVPRKKDENDPEDVGPGVHITFRKNKAPVELTAQITLDSFLKEKPGPSAATAVGTQGYSIQSIVHHIGSTANSGHYTADALRIRPNQPGKNMTWVSFDDTKVETLTATEVLTDVSKQKTAYMMLYTLD